MFSAKYLFFIATQFLIFSLVAAAVDTPDFWNCNNRVSGSWVFGRAPYACDIDPFADPNFVREKFGMLAFRDLESASPERARYMQELFSVLREAADYYIRRRKPTVSAAEVSAWEQATYAVAHQESVWSHYRVASDARMKLMRGDSGHGHGLMQVDDRWHFVAVEQGSAAQLVQNIMYALDLYYSGWEAATKSACPVAVTNFRDRARAAYSAYNGGATKICRWTNPNDTWARNDVGFLEKWDGKMWQSYVSDPTRAASINVACYAEGGTNCSGPVEPPRPSLDANILYKTSNGAFCMAVDGKLRCVDSLADSNCLELSLRREVRATQSLDALLEKSITQEIVDRHNLCANAIPGLARVGQMVRTKKSINLRVSPGGDLVATLPNAAFVQVLDFNVADADQVKRYYFVEYQGKSGYFYAGDETDFTTWAEALAVSPGIRYQSGIALAGQNIRVVPNGVNLRDAINGKILTVVPKNALIPVRAIEVRGKENLIYYSIEYRGALGFLFGGQIFPTRNTTTWVKVE